MRSWVWAAEWVRSLSWSKRMVDGTQHSAPFVLNCTPHLLQHFTINSRVYCCALGKNSTRRAPCLSQNTVRIIYLIKIVCLLWRNWKALFTIFHTCPRKGTNISEHLQGLLIISISVLALAEFLCNFIESQVAINLSDLHISTDNIMQEFQRL